MIFRTLVAESRPRKQQSPVVCPAINDPDINRQASHCATHGHPHQTAPKEEEETTTNSSSVFLLSLHAHYVADFPLEPVPDIADATQRENESFLIGHLVHTLIPLIIDFCRAPFQTLLQATVHKERSTLPVALDADVRPFFFRQTIGMEHERIAIPAESDPPGIFPIGIDRGMRPVEQDAADVRILVPEIRKETAYG